MGAGGACALVGGGENPRLSGGAPSQVARSLRRRRCDAATPPISSVDFSER